MTNPLDSPPHARLAYRVSIVGHRPNRLPKDRSELDILRGRISSALAAAKEAVLDFQTSAEDARLYSPEPPLLRAISPLAEGSDRMFAEEALRLGYSLCCPMPFAQSAFEEDFAPDTALEPDSIEHFRAILSQARGGAGLEVFELDGQRTSEEAMATAYQAAGRVVMNQSDLMLIVWDGGRSAGEGGTVDTLREAVRFHLPVVWIDAVAPFSWMVVRSEADLAHLDGAERSSPLNVPSADLEEENRRIAKAVSHIVRQEIALPAAMTSGGDIPDKAALTRPSVHQEALNHALDYFRERQRPRNIFFVWELFCNIVVDLKFTVTRIRATDFISTVCGSWPRNAEEDPQKRSRPTAYWVNDAIRNHFAWSDQLADLYADAYRTAFLMSYLLAAMAVLVALLPRAMRLTAEDAPVGTISLAADWAIVLSVAELAMLLCILGMVLLGRSRRWHERWMEYRVLAELIRALKLLIPLGGGRPLPRTSTHLAVYGDPAQTWMYWHVRAIARATGLPSVEATPAFLAECLDTLYETADAPTVGQRTFHESRFKRYEHLHERLHFASVALFGMTVIAVILQSVLFVLSKRFGEAFRIEMQGDWLILATAFLPAVAAALAGINNHGECLRIAKRSRAMADGLARFGNTIRELRTRLEHGERVALAEVIPLAGKLAETMVDEVIDWRVVVLDRPQTAG